MSFNRGDFILVEYTVRVKDTGALVDTTDAELAKRENMYDPNKLYGPILIVLGKNWLNSHIEEQIMSMNENEEKEIELPPGKAYGERDPSKVKVFSLREFQRRGYSVSIGDVVEIGGVRGIIKRINGGRVVVDFNHPLAGKTLVYKVRVVKKLEEFTEKAKYLSSRHLRIPGDEVAIDYIEGEKKLVVKIPSKYIAREYLGYAKLALAADVFDLFKDRVSTLIYQEEVRKPGT